MGKYHKKNSKKKAKVIKKAMNNDDTIYWNDYKDTSEKIG